MSEKLQRKIVLLVMFASVVFFSVGIMIHNMYPAGLGVIGFFVSFDIFVNHFL
jgi:hypothetical protein